MSRAEWITIITATATIIATLAGPIMQALLQHWLNNPKPTPIANAPAEKKTLLSKIFHHPGIDNWLSLISILGSVIGLMVIYLSQPFLSKGDIFTIGYYFSIITFNAVAIFLTSRTKSLKRLTEALYSQIDIIDTHQTAIKLLMDTQAHNDQKKVTDIKINT